jgi:hypothetical protein
MALLYYEELSWYILARLCKDRKDHHHRSAAYLNALITKHADMFENKLGYCKPRSVPYTTKKAIEDELDNLKANGILKKVSYAEWAAPIVKIPKKDGKIRICGDYKVIVNPVVQVDQYL